MLKIKLYTVNLEIANIGVQKIWRFCLKWSKIINNNYTARYRNFEVTKTIHWKSRFSPVVNCEQTNLIHFSFPVMTSFMIYILCMHTCLCQLSYLFVELSFVQLYLMLRSTIIIDIEVISVREDITSPTNAKVIYTN